MKSFAGGIFEINLIKLASEHLGHSTILEKCQIPPFCSVNICFLFSFGHKYCPRLFNYYPFNTQLVWKCGIPRRFSCWLIRVLMKGKCWKHLWTVSSSLLLIFCGWAYTCISSALHSLDTHSLILFLQMSRFFYWSQSSTVPVYHIIWIVIYPYK